jgi:hypothetical protein
MTKIPTAEDFLQEHSKISHFYDDKTNQMVCFSADVQKALIEFAKLHVEAALKAAATNGEIKEELGNPYDTESKYYVVDEQSIIKAYPLTNIK